MHVVQDMSKYSHPNADLSKGEYGCVGQGLHIAKRLLPYIPKNAGILLVPCARGGSAFTGGAEGTFDEATGATESSMLWGVEKPLYKDLVSRTKKALEVNPKNKLLAVVWMQGEYDLTKVQYAQQPALFNAMVERFRTDLSDHLSQMPEYDTAEVPWICGDTTYYWKEKYPAQYETVYGNYRNNEQKISFLFHSCTTIMANVYRLMIPLTILLSLVRPITVLPPVLLKTGRLKQGIAISVLGHDAVLSQRE